MTDWEAQVTLAAQGRASPPWGQGATKCNTIETKDFWTFWRIVGLIKSLEVIAAFSR
jgi:hypothetical protein